MGGLVQKCKAIFIGHSRAFKSPRVWAVDTNPVSICHTRTTQLLMMKIMMMVRACDVLIATVKRWAGAGGRLDDRFIRGRVAAPLAQELWPMTMGGRGSNTARDGYREDLPNKSSTDSNGSEKRKGGKANRTRPDPNHSQWRLAPVRAPVYTGYRSTCTFLYILRSLCETNYVPMDH